jgi:hypothetical protein
MKIPFTHWPQDRITDDTAVTDRIQAAVLAERERCAKVAESTAGGASIPDSRDLSEFVRGYFEARSHIAAKIRNGE